MSVNSANPYIAGPPLRGRDQLFGRTRLLAEVRRELTNPAIPSVLLYGQRRIGKTSILRALEETLPEEAFLPV